LTHSYDLIFYSFFQRKEKAWNDLNYEV